MGGLEEGPVKLKCLHLHYAHYLARRARLTLMTEETDGKMVENISELNMNMAGKRVHEEILARHAYYSFFCTIALYMYFTKVHVRVRVLLKVWYQYLFVFIKCVSLSLHYYSSATRIYMSVVCSLP